MLNGSKQLIMKPQEERSMGQHCKTKLLVYIRVFQIKTTILALQDKAQAKMNMEANSTSTFTEIVTTNEEEEDPRILATSYIMYKVGEYYFWFTFKITFKIIETNEACSLEM